jgi:hypothetical protein
MKRLYLLSLLLIGLLFSYLFFGNEIKLSFYKNDLLTQEKLCQQAKRDFMLQDNVTINESNETKVNVFLNAKYNMNTCYDLELLRSKLIAEGISQKKIKYLELKAIESDSGLIEFAAPKK